MTPLAPHPHRLRYHPRPSRPVREHTPGLGTLAMIVVVTVSVVTLYLLGAQVVLICLVP